MGEKKVVGRTVVIALGIICVILAVGLVGAIANYTSIISGKDNTIATNITYYNSQINSLNAQITDLENQINTLKAPKLIKVHLMSDDNRPWLGTPYLHVYGYICNVGIYTAYSSKIHVVAYQSGGVVAIDTYITLGPIYGESWTSVDSNIYYSGSALVSWTLTLEWTA